MYTQDLAACILCEIILDGRPHAMLLDHTQLIPTHPEYIHATSRTLPIPPNAPYYLGCLTMVSVCMARIECDNIYSLEETEINVPG